MNSEHHTLQQVINRLSKDDIIAGNNMCHEPLPSIDAVTEIIRLVKAILFPEHLDAERYDASMRHYYIGANIERLHTLLAEQIRRSLTFSNPDCSADQDSKGLSLHFISALPEIRHLLLQDITAMYENDPAASGVEEVIFCYPGANAMIHYRIAHTLLTAGIPLLPRIITELAHSATGIDIHPGAVIGSHFSIDHGTGIVIGETCIIGHHVRLYQGVTLGAKNFKLDDVGHPLNIPRHPIIEDHVTIYSNSTILGRITIGHHTTIGGNLWVTRDIAPNSRIIQRPALTDPS